MVYTNTLTMAAVWLDPKMHGYDGTCRKAGSHYYCYEVVTRTANKRKGEKRRRRIIKK